MRDGPRWVIIGLGGEGIKGGLWTEGLVKIGERVITGDWTFGGGGGGITCRVGPDGGPVGPIMGLDGGPIMGLGGGPTGPIMGLEVGPVGPIMCLEVGPVGPISDGGGGVNVPIADTAWGASGGLLGTLWAPLGPSHSRLSHERGDQKHKIAVFEELRTKFPQRDPAIKLSIFQQTS